MTPESRRSGPGIGPASPEELDAFEDLKAQLVRLWERLKEHPTTEHTAVIVPSLSFDQDELAKVQGAEFYEERLLFALIRLRSPGARVIYVTSNPLHPDTIDYYLQLLGNVPVSHARRRFLHLCVQDASLKPLTQKILERPRVVARLRDWIGDPSTAYLTCYNATPLERRLAVLLGIPLNGLDPTLLHLGTKSGCRKLFREAGVLLPAGFEDLTSEDDVVDALVELAKVRPQVRRAVVKLNEGFSGEGNAVFTFPEGAAARERETVRATLQNLAWSHPDETFGRYMDKLKVMGGIVEEFLEGRTIRSPSAQFRIDPGGGTALVSTHDQVLGGATGQVYLGCRFPADAGYRPAIQEAGRKVAAALSGRGVLGRFAIDFVVQRNADETWTPYAVEINLRMSGTTPPFMALELLVGGGLDPEGGEYQAHSGKRKYYYATDNLKSPAYRGLLPEDLMDIIAEYGVRFDASTQKGVLFYMIGALSQYGKLGVVSIGDSRQEADELFEHAVAILDQEVGADRRSRGRLHPLFEHGRARIE